MRIPETVPEDWRRWTKIPHRDASLSDGSAYRQTEDGRIFKMRDPQGKYVGQMVSRGGALWSKLTQEIRDQEGEFGFFLIATAAGAAGWGTAAGYRAEDFETQSRVRGMSNGKLRKVSKERWRQKSVRVAARKELARRSKIKKQKALEAKQLRAARRAARDGDSVGMVPALEIEQFGISKSELRSMSAGKLRRISKSIVRKKSIKAAARKELKRRKTDKRWKKKIAAEGRKETAALRALTECRSGGEEMGFVPVNPVLDQIGDQLMFAGVVDEDHYGLQVPVGPFVVGFPSRRQVRTRLARTNKRLKRLQSGKKRKGLVIPLRSRAHRMKMLKERRRYFIQALRYQKKYGDKMGWKMMKSKHGGIPGGLFSGDDEYGGRGDMPKTHEHGGLTRSGHEAWLRKEGLTYAHNFNVDLYANRDLNAHGMWKQGAMESAGQALATHLTHGLFHDPRTRIMFHDPELERLRGPTRRLQRGELDLQRGGGAMEDSYGLSRPRGYDRLAKRYYGLLEKRSKIYERIRKGGSGKATLRITDGRLRSIEKRLNKWWPNLSANQQSTRETARTMYGKYILGSCIGGSCPTIAMENRKGPASPFGGSANHDDGVMDRHFGLDYDWYEEIY